MNRSRLLILATVMGMLLMMASPAIAQQARVVFNAWVLVDRLSVDTGGATIAGGGLTVTDGGVTLTDDDLTLTSGDLTQVDGDVTVADDLTISKQITFTVGTNGIITPTGSYQVIAASAARGVGTIVTGAAGDLLLLINTGSNTITLTDTGTLRLSGNAALAQNDTILLMSDGVNWIQIAPEGDN